MGVAMRGKIATCVLLFHVFLVNALYSQNAAQPSVGEGTGSARALPLASDAAQAAVIRGEGISDEVFALNCVALITGVRISGNLATFTGVNQLVPGQEVRITKLNRATYLNDAVLKVVSATPDSFTANFSHAGVDFIHDGGTALRTDCAANATFRSNQKIEIFHNNLNFFKQHLSSDIQLAKYDHFLPAEQNTHYASSTFSAPSYSWGNNGGWGVQKHRYDEVVFNSRGIAQVRNLVCRKHGTGDTACGDYIYGFTDGGSTAQSDEGFTVDTREGGETDSYFHGTVGKSATTGATVLPVIFKSGQDTTTDGAFLLDITKGTISGTVSGLDSIVDGTSTHVLPVAVSSAEHMTPSTGVGIIQTPIPIIAIANVPESIRLDVSLTHGAFKPGIACLAGGWYPEQVRITAVSPPSGTKQEITLIHKNPNPTAATDPNNPSSLWQGGPCGTYLSLDRNFARDGFRTSYPVVGATDAEHIAYVWNVNGSTRQNGIKLYLPPTPLSHLVRKNGIVTAHFSKANAPVIYNRAASVVIAGAGDPSLNGVVAAPEYGMGSDGSLSWKQAGPDTTAASATIDLPPASYGFHLYPGAEVLAPQTPDGVPLEPNAVAWESGDIIENPHNPSFQMRFRANLVIQHTPPSGGDSHGEIWGFVGAGISSNFRPSRWINDNPCSLYIGCGGTLDPITWTIHHGPYSILHRVDTAPMNGGILFRIGCDSLGCDHPKPYALFELQNGYITYDPATSTVTTTALRASRFNGDNASFDRLSLNKMPAQGTDCLGIQDQVVVSGRSQPKSAPCITSIAWHGGNGLSVQQSGTAAQPVYTIVPEPGYYIPKTGNKLDSAADAATNSAVATISKGGAIAEGSVACAEGYRCSATRGRIAISGVAATSAGKIASVQVTLLPGQICTATQNGGTTFLGIGSSGEAATGFDITSSVPVRGKVLVDYFCR